MRAALWTAGLATLLIGFMWFASAPRAGECGIASWYSYTGHRTANGERFDGSGMTAASRSLPFGSHVRVTLVHTSRSVTVRINDRGPFVAGRIIDLSKAAALALGITRQGTAMVCLSPGG